MKQILTLLLGALLSGCNLTNKTNNNQVIPDLAIDNKNEITSKLKYEDYKILNGQLGNIKLGMTIPEAEKQFSGLSKKVDYATNFGFDGGSPAFLYYSGDELIFGLIPKLDTDTLLYIIAAHKKLQTTNGLNPNSSIGELIQKYPNLTVEQDLMNGWEIFEDTINRWQFVFMTDEKTQIGEYPELEVPSKPKRITTKTDWITIQ
jgi:hypothetical protein